MRWSVASVAVVAAALVVPGVAQSADMPVRKAAPVAVVPVFSWTGFYIGAHGGGAWGNSTWNDVGPAGGLVLDVSNKHDTNGALGGVQVGYNFQAGAWVLGVEGDFSWSSIKGNGAFDPPPAGFGPDPIESRIRWLATGTGRIGYAFGQWLPYVRGGVAVADARYSLAIPIIALTASTDDTRVGYLVGGGVEYGFTNNWSARLGYDYFGFGTEQIRFVSPVLPILPNFPFDVKQHLHVVKFAVNYRFGR